MSNKIDMAYIFNKESGEMLASIEYNPAMKLGDTYTVFKVVKIDVKTETYVGNYKSGSVRNIEEINTELAEKVVIFEENVNTMAATKITSTYSLNKQLNILGNAINKLAEGKTEPEFDELRRMIRYISHTRTNNARIKSIYEQSENHVLVPKGDLSAKVDRELSGQLLAAMGTPDLEHRRSHKNTAEHDE